MNNPFLSVEEKLDQIEKERLKEVEGDNSLEEYRGKWGILVFTTKFIKSPIDYCADSREMVEKDLITLHKNVEKKDENHEWFVKAVDGNFYFNKRHFISAEPIPIKG